MNTLILLLLASLGIWLPVIVINALKRQLFKSFGYKRMLFPAAIGVPIHETSHLLLALMCGHKINKVAFFKPNQSGGLGFVEHSYRPSLISPITNLLIGLAPLAGGLLALALLTKTLQPSLYDFIQQHQAINSASLAGQYTTDIWHKVINSEWTFIKVIWLFLSMSAIAFMTPSGTDFKGSIKGFLVIYLAAFAVGLISPKALMATATSLIEIIVTVTPLFLLSIIVMTLFTVFTVFLKKRKEASLSS